MFNPFKYFFKKNRQNTPQNTPHEAPPAQPLGEPESSLPQGKPVQQEAFDQAMASIQQKFDISNILVISVILVLAICFITLFYGYWQFASTSFSDYSQKVKELSNEKFQFHEDRLLKLEEENKELKKLQIQFEIYEKQTEATPSGG